MVMFPGLFSDKLSEMGANVICLGNDCLSPTPANLLIMIEMIRDKIRPDIIHFNGPDSDAPSVFLAADLLSIPTIQHLRSYDILKYVEQLRYSDRVIAVSEFVKRRALALEIPELKFDVLLDEVDTEYFDPSRFERIAERIRFGLPLDSKVAVMVARYEPYKRHDIILNAATPKNADPALQNTA